MKIIGNTVSTPINPEKLQGPRGYSIYKCNATYALNTNGGYMIQRVESPTVFTNGIPHENDLFITVSGYLGRINYMHETTDNEGKPCITWHYEYIADLNGADGYTPIRGTDYWTPEDKNEILADIKAEEGAWEEIETFKVAESGLYVVARQSFPDGTPYNLSAVKAIVNYYYPVTNTYGIRMDLNSHGVTLAQLVQQVTGWSDDPTYKSTCVFNALPKSGLYDFYHSYGTQGGAMNLFNPPNGAGQTISTDNKITSINLVHWSGGPVPVGTEISIWGVRANG